MLVKLSAMILGAMFLCGMAGTAKADDWCARHITHQQYELDKAVRHHGYNSWQADHERRELRRVRDECRYR